MNLTAAIYDALTADATLVGLLAIYDGGPALFTIDPPPGDAELPYIVAAGHVSDSAWDTKLQNGRMTFRDVRCYAAADGSALTVEAIAERVRVLLHRVEITVAGFDTVTAECSGPLAADEEDAYGRIVTVAYRLLEG